MALGLEFTQNWVSGNWIYQRQNTTQEKAETRQEETLTGGSPLPAGRHKLTWNSFPWFQLSLQI